MTGSRVSRWMNLKGSRFVAAIRDVSHYPILFFFKSKSLFLGLVKKTHLKN
jgi:hypothetical protein